MVKKRAEAGAKPQAQGLDLGVLQKELEASTRAVKSAGTKLENAQNAWDAAQARRAAAGDRLKAAARAVMGAGA